MSSTSGSRSRAWATRPPQKVVSRDREVGKAQQLRQLRRLPEDRHRLLGADDGDRHHGHAGPHGDLHEAAATEATQAVALAVELAWALAALGEDQDELLLLAE